METAVYTKKQELEIGECIRILSKTFGSRNLFFFALMLNYQNTGSAKTTRGQTISVLNLKLK